MPDRRPAPPGASLMVVLAAFAAAGAEAQAPPVGAGGGPVPPAPADGPPAQWFASVAYQREFIDSDLPQWEDWSLAQALVLRDFAAGALGVELFRAGRFRTHDEGFAVDGYRNLWAGAYANVRVRVTPDADLLPSVDGRGELFQSLPGGWEVSGSYWVMDFDRHDVQVAGAGVAHYRGNWYLRQTATLSRLAGESSLATAVTARRFLAGAREFVEVAGGLGREAVILGEGPRVESRDTGFVQGRVQRFLTPRWGLTGAVSYNRFEGTPGRLGVTLGLLARF
ncbi:MAG: YaiO family outer membrane beta-barrel protein [Longimicrobiales bacterium]|nr:YaiO family outer membrane beta-barrel protein [Longimicrobiales bacterium]